MHAEIMEGLERRLMRLADYVPAGSRVVYIDYPLHLNVGDLLINAGAEELMRALNYEVVNRFNLWELGRPSEAPDGSARFEWKPWAFEHLRATPPDVVFLLHGGGNFGDLYPQFQLLREGLVAGLPDRQIVFLPQSVHFSSEPALQASLARLAAHPRLKILVRDQESLAMIDRHAPGLADLAPDTAHALWSGLASERGRSGKGALRLIRRDIEAGSDGSGPGSVDWDDLIKPADQLAFRLLGGAYRRNWFGRGGGQHRAWYAFRDWIIGRAVRMFASSAAVETDRLHAVILAALLERPVVFHDNSYGKLSRYASAWLNGDELVSAG